MRNTIRTTILVFLDLLRLAPTRPGPARTICPSFDRALRRACVCLAEGRPAGVQQLQGTAMSAIPHPSPLHPQPQCHSSPCHQSAFASQAGWQAPPPPPHLSRPSTHAPHARTPTHPYAINTRGRASKYVRRYPQGTQMQCGTARKVSLRQDYPSLHPLWSVTPSCGSE